MSTATVARNPKPSRTTPAPTPRRTPAPPALHVVTAPPWRAPLAPFILLSVGVVVTGLLALLALNTLVAQDSFRVQQLERESTELREREQLLRTDVARQKAPGALAARAATLGLVPGNTPGFLRLRDGRVTGAPIAARAPLPPPPPVPELTVAPPVDAPLVGALVKPAPANPAAETLRNPADAVAGEVTAAPGPVKPPATKAAGTVTQPPAKKPLVTKPAATKQRATKAAPATPPATP